MSESHPRLLENKVILVTGAGRGIGRAHALALAEQGARVVVNDIGTDVRGDGFDPSLAALVVSEIEATGGTALASDHDISTWDGAAGAVHAGVEAFGRIDGLLNNAGIVRKASLVDLTEADFDAIVAVHLKGAFACTVHALAHWRSCDDQGLRTRASVVNTFSEVVLVGLPGYSIYGAAKAGVLQLTTVASREASAFGVRVNAYGPRALTRMMPGVEEISRDEPHPMDAMNSSPLVLWLLSEASAHVTGQVFQTVGGGIARCQPWSAGEMVWPSDGRLRFEPDEVGPILDSEMFHCRYPDRPMQEPPGFSAELAQ
jgi:NAD(P)-dependent dehydrogenase (short-subunit alcohol dehydrogenase family)